MKTVKVKYSTFGDTAEVFVIEKNNSYRREYNLRDENSFIDFWKLCKEHGVTMNANPWTIGATANRANKLGHSEELRHPFTLTAMNALVDYCETVFAAVAAADEKANGNPGMTEKEYSKFLNKEHNRIEAERKAKGR